MPKEQRTFTKESRQEAVRLALTGGKSITQVARDLGIADSTLKRRPLGRGRKRMRCWRAASSRGIRPVNRSMVADGSEPSWLNKEWSVLANVWCV
jgi:transposase-like protein